MASSTTDESDQEQQKLLPKDGQGSNGKPKPKKNPFNPKLDEIRSCKDCFYWFKKDPCGRWPIIYFISTFLGCVALAVMYILTEGIGNNPMQKYLIIGIVGSSCAIVGANHFRLLMNLTEGVDQLQELNGKFHVENGLLSGEVDRLAKTVKELKKVRVKLTGGITDMRENIDKMDQLNDNLDKFNVQNVEQINALMDKAKKMGQKWKEELVANERNLLHSIFDKFELMDAESGMTKKEYLHFCRQLPERYMAKIVKLDFFEYYKDKNGLLNFAEFGMALDILADLEIKGLPMKKFKELFANQKKQDNDDNYYVQVANKRKDSVKKSDKPGIKLFGFGK